MAASEVAAATRVGKSIARASRGTMTTPPPTPNSPENSPATVPTPASWRVLRIAGHTRGRVPLAPQPPRKPPPPGSPPRRAGGPCASRAILGAVPPSTAEMLDELLRPLREDPERSAVLLDVDGVLAPIVQHPDDAHMPETTRRPLIEVAKRYGVVACVSGRRASDARRVVSLGSIAYLGSHGSEILRPGSITPEMDRELQA